MKKLKLFFACLLMAVLSIGQVWGEDVMYPDGTNFTTAWTKSSRTAKQTYATKTALQMMGKNKGVYGEIISENAYSNISGISVNCTANNAIQLKLYYSADKSEWTELSANDIAKNTSGYTDYNLTITGIPATAVYLKLESQANSIYMYSVTVSTGSSDACLAPTFSPAAGAVVSGTAVTLSTNTEGASIYYTMGENPADPTIGSTLYDPENKPVISSATTIKAIAVKDGLNNSSVASASYTVVTPLTTMDAIFAAATTAGSTATDVYITFNNWQISGVKNKNAFLTDGTKGAVIYSTSNSEFVENNVLSGTVACKVQLFKQFAEITSLIPSSTGLTVTTGSALTPAVKTIDQLSAVNTGALVKVENLTYDGTNLSDGENTIITYSTFYSASLENGKKYDITGIFQYYDGTKQLLPRSADDVVEVVEEGAPETPTFSPAAGIYTSAQSVEISCTTEGAAIYYTTDGSTPDNTSTGYTSAISVGENMTIKAVAIKDAKSSTVATAAYIINLPEDETVQKTWDLSIDETATASADALTWAGTYVAMSFAKASAGTNANNYYPGTSGQSYTSTRTYKNSVITITPNGKQITSIVFEATSSGYATALKNSAWTNATAVADNTTITVTPTNGKNAISAVIGGTCGFTSVQVNYEAISATAPADPTFSVAAGEYTEVKSVELSCETDGATIYYTTDGSTPNNTSTEYTAAITVDEDMTIKAIAYLGEEASGVAEAAYVINLPVSEEDQKTWDLSIDETATASADALTWTATYVDMSVTSGTAAANNYYPGTSGKSYTSTRFYNGATLTITPNGKQITSIVIETDGATPFKNATWTNGTATNVDKTVTITVTSPGAVTAVFQANATAFSVQVNYTAIDPSFPVAPVLTPAAGTYDAVQTVEITCETVGATIYYTTDGTAPDNTSIEYTGAITVDEDMTIKAVAINGEKVGPIVTAVYKINLPLTTMDAILARATAIGSTAEEVNIQFNNWVVSGVGTDEKTVYVTDGSKGFIIYGSNHDFAVNDKISGTAACNLKLYNKVAEVVDLKANATGLTVTNDGEVNVASIALAGLGAVNTGALIALNNMKYDGTYLTDGTTSIKPYNSLYADAAFVENHYYNVTGIYVHYNTTKEIAPRSAADIEELQATAPAMQWYVSNTKEETIGASHIIRVGDEFAPFFETNSDGSLTFTSSDPTIAEIDENTGVLTLKDVVGSTTITCAVAADVDQNLLADSKSFTLQVKAQLTVDNVVIVAFVNDKWYALQNVAGTTSGSLLGVEVNYSENKIWDLPAAEQAAITWKRTVDGADVTFQDGSNNYLKGTTGGAALTLDVNVHNWNWYADGGYYRIGESARTFFVNYVANDDENIFKNFATSNLNKTNYSGLAVVTAAVFDVTPEPPTPVYETVRDGLTAGNYYTICYPKAMTDIQGATLWSFVGKDAESAYIEMETATTIEAGKPYIMYATASTVTAVLGDETNAPGANGAIHGTFSKLEQDQLNNYALVAGNDLYLVIGNELCRVTGYALDGITPLTGNSLPAQRAFVVLSEIQDGTPTPAPGKKVRKMPMQGQTTTGCEFINAAEAPAKMMINGQLFILRGEKKYDATGRLVK